MSPPTTRGMEDRAVAGQKDSEPFGEDETKGIVEDAAFDDRLLNYRQRGNKLELIGSGATKDLTCLGSCVSLTRELDPSLRFG